MLYGEQCLTPEEVNDDGILHWYYLHDVTGARVYGWKYVDAGAKWVHYDAITGWMDYGEQFIPCGNNQGDAYHWYYFDEETGATQYGWKHLDASAKWVHYDAVMGWMHYGEHFLPCNNSEGASEHWYYFDPETGAAHYGWTWIGSGNKAVFYDEVSAWMVYGWLDYQGKRYHLDEIDGRLDAVFGNNIVVDRYVNWTLGIAADDSHGYDQLFRWNELGDYDCSSLVVSALRQAGLDTGGATYTGNMKSSLTARGFRWITDFSQLQCGDILLNIRYHTAIYLGNGLLVHASGNEYGEAIGGEPGDQTGSEICVRSYFWRPWDGFLRYVG